VAAVVIFGGVVSTLGFVAGNAFGTPRYAYAMARDGYLPRALAWIDPRRGVPLGAIIATCIASTVMTLGFSDGPLFAMSNLAVAVQYLGTSLAVGKSGLGKAAPRRIPRVVLGMLGTVVSVWILGKGTAGERRIAALALVCGVLLGIGSRFWAKRRAGGSRSSAA
jgi:APA family basic amino acid/polyamine antiporter